MVTPSLYLGTTPYVASGIKAFVIGTGVRSGSFMEKIPGRYVTLERLSADWKLAKMRTKETYYMRFGSRRVPWMIIKEGHDRSQYVIFPMDQLGFHIS